MSDIVVKLSWAEVTQAGLGGVQRQCRALYDGTPDKYGSPEGKLAWGAHVLGAMAEKAVCRYYDFYWDPTVGLLNEDDAGPLQVRSIDDPGHRLILHPDDKDWKVFILVYTAPPRFTMKGWIMAEHGKREEYWEKVNDHRAPAFFVPQRVLRPMTELDPRAIRPKHL